MSRTVPQPESQTPAPYSTPSEIGGVLIRRVLALFKERAFAHPIEVPVLISVSGGVDSMVLAHLVCRYGRKIIDPKLVTLLHFDHGWRKESSTTERDAVESLAKSLGVKFKTQTLDPPAQPKSTNLEEDGRLKRQAAYQEVVEAHPQGVFIFTGHHETDAIESMFWRFLRGEFFEYREGIKFQDSASIRPFLKVTKTEILDYAKSEGVSYHEDPTNQDEHQYRAWMRNHVMPLLKSHFPGVEKNLAKYLLKNLVQDLTATTSGTIGVESGVLPAVEAVVGVSLNRAQRNALHQMTLKLSPGATLSLPGGTQIRRTPDGFFIEKLDGSDRRNKA